MKKLFALLLALALMVSAAALADVDLSGMTFDELVALKDQINLAIWNSQEWQEVTVPQGLWKVGEDIPAGTWAVKCADVYRDEPFMYLTWLSWGPVLDDDGEPDYLAPGYNSTQVFNPENEYYNGMIAEDVIELHDGDYLLVSKDNAPAVFMPYTGKPSLGFK